VHWRAQNKRRFCVQSTTVAFQDLDANIGIQCTECSAAQCSVDAVYCFQKCNRLADGIHMADLWADACVRRRREQPSLQATPGQRTLCSLYARSRGFGVQVDLAAVSLLAVWVTFDFYIIIIIIIIIIVQTFITRSSSVMILNQRRWQSLWWAAW